MSLPSGTVTLWFTDVEDSTRRWADDEAGMRALMARHDEIMDDVLASHGGVLVKHNGDGIDAVFTSASHAVAAATEAQERLQAIGLPVRMGVHTGEAELRDRDYFGSAVNLAARIMDAGHGGQILLSQATAGLVRGPTLTELGEHRLKGVPEPQRIVQVGDGAFPALRVEAELRGNLPNELTEFVGRDDAVKALTEQLDGRRMVTLLGVGGAGKTRLALETARATGGRFADGCWLVQLARIAVPEAVPHAVCAGIEAVVPEQGDVVQFLINRMRHRRLLLVLDNCEHVLDAAAAVAEEILAHCPKVTILATSREPLMVAGEHLVPTASLDIAPAVALFRSRLGAEAPSIVIDDEQERAIAAICERLDRLPLAIELAASRARSMLPTEIEARLDERFRLLVGGRRSRMERHQTMRGTVDWSYDLCTPLERHVFDRLSVFAGEFDLDAALAVAADSEHDPLDVEDAVHHLVDRSLVQRIVSDDHSSRFRLLETMRAYGREHLFDRDESDAARERHAAYVSARHATLTNDSLGPDEARVHHEIRGLVADIALAVDWCLERRQWQYLPKLTAIGVTVAAPGVALAIQARVVDALPPLDEAVNDVPALWHVAMHCYGASSDKLGTVRLAQRRIVELVGAGETMPVDTAYLLPFAQSVDAPPGFIDAMRRLVDLVADGPLIAQWVARFLATLSLTGHDAVTVERLLDELRVMSDSIGGPTARRRYLMQVALHHEVCGQLAEAEDLLREALPGEPVAWSDVLVAVRIVRVSGGLHGVLRGDDLRRPIEWMQWLSTESMAPAVLASTAAALLACGYDDLAERAAGALAAQGVGEYYSKLIGLSMDGSEQLFIRPDLPHAEVDEVLHDILLLADELEQVAGSAHEVSGG